MRLLWITIILFYFWLMLSGHFTSLFLALGAVSTLLVVVMLRRLRSILPPSSKSPRQIEIRPLKAIAYLFWLIGQIVIANLHVAWRVLSPFAKIAPHMIEVPTPQKTPLGEFIFASSITLTPGTISVATQKDTILVHALTQTSGNLNDLAFMDQQVSSIET